MIKKLQNVLYSQLFRHSFSSDDEKYLFLISNVACVYAMSMHVFLLFFYLAIGIWPFFFINIISILLYVLHFLLVGRRHYLVPGILLSVEVMAYTFLSTYYFGANNYVILYLFVTLMMQMVVPYARIRVRGLMIVLLWASMLGVLYMGFHDTPVWDIGSANIVLTVFNVHLAILGAVAELSIGNIIKKTIAQFNQRQLEKFKNEANVDPLTGLYNRRYADSFFEKLRGAPSGQTWCVAMLDIDDFKVINDVNGHQIGDAVLVEVAGIIKANLRKTDLVFRWGGEEFLVLLKDVDVSTAYQILDKLRGSLADTSLEPDGKILRATVTIGVCALDIRNIVQSISTCDSLMYQGKNMEKNVVVM